MESNLASHWREQTATVAAIEVNVLTGGQGDPLVVLHGGGGNPGWMGYHEALAEHFDVIAPTHPGFGALGRSSRWFSRSVRKLDGLIWFYHRFLKSLGFGPLRVMGFCLGGWLAAELAVRYPELFSHMVLVGAPGVRAPDEFIADPFRMTARKAKKAIFYNPAQVPDNCTPSARGGYRAVARDWNLSDRMTMPDRWNPALVRSLGRLRLPTLLVWGEHDAMVPVEVGETYERAIPGARLTVIERCGHAAYMERPDAFMAQVLPFLKPDSPGARSTTSGEIPALAAAVAAPV